MKEEKKEKEGTKKEGEKDKVKKNKRTQRKKIKIKRKWRIGRKRANAEEEIGKREGKLKDQKKEVYERNIERE